MDSGVQRKMREERVGDAESKLRGGGGCLQNVTLGLGLRKKHVIYIYFFNVGLVEPVQSVSNFENRNRTELDFFCDFSIG